MAKIGIFLEQRHNKVVPVGLELISEVRKQIGTHEVEIVGVILTQKLDKEELEKIKNVGVNRIIILKNDRFFRYDTSDYSLALRNLLKKEDFDVFLLGSTLIGRDLGPRLSAHIHTGLTADATILNFSFDNDEFTLLATRPALGGNLMATIICPDHRPQMATVRPGVFSIYHNPLPNVVVEEKDVKIKEPSKVRLIETTPIVKKGPDLTKAKVIVSAGRGVAKKVKEVEQVADLFGAEFAASRAVVDAGILERERLVGQTGKTVKPFVYLALGISGAIQHVAGMDKSELIIAVNTDPKAAIFSVADVSIVADAHEVLLLLEKYLTDIHKSH